MKKRGYLYLIIWIVSVYSFHTCKAFAASSSTCAILFKHPYDKNTQLLVKQLEVPPHPDIIKRLNVRWIAINKKSSEFFNIWYRNDPISFKIIDEINKKRIGPSNTFRSNSTKTLNRWIEANKLILTWENGHKLTLDDIIAINQLVSEVTNNDKGPGILRFREYYDDFIFDKQFGFKAVDVKTGLDELISWYNSQNSNPNSILVATQFIQKFLTIHPFHNGNGRTGRLLLDWILISHGMPPASFIQTDAAFMKFGDESGVSIDSALDKVTKAIEASLKIAGIE